MSHCAYEKIRSPIERLGGSMTYERKGYRYGAWVIRIGESSVTIQAGGNRSFPELDGLYIPRVPEPKHWDDYLDELVSDLRRGCWPCWASQAIDQNASPMMT